MGSKPSPDIRTPLFCFTQSPPEAPLFVVYVFSQDKGRTEETCVGLLTQLSCSFKIDTAKC